MNTLELEEAVNDAAYMARITVEYVGQVLDFDSLNPRPLDAYQRQRLVFAIMQTMALAEEARAAFYEEGK